MGFLKKLRKRDDRYARVAKSKAKKRDAREVYRYQMAQEAAERELYELEARCLRDTQVIFFTVLNEEFGFGAKRLLDLSGYVRFIGECIKDKRLGVNLDGIRKQLAEDTGYEVKMSDIKGGPEIQVQKAAVDQISILYLLELHDKYGFGKRRLEKMYRRCAEVGSMLSHGKCTINDLNGRLELIGIAPKFRGKRVSSMLEEEAV